MSWWFEKDEDSIFLIINGERARNPRNNLEFEAIESVRSGRSSEEIWITFKNQGSSGRRINRKHFKKETEFSEMINDENNSAFVIDFYKNCNLQRNEVRSRAGKKRKSGSQTEESCHESQLHLISSVYNENLLGEYEINVDRILRPPKEYMCRTLKEAWISTIEMALKAMPVVNTVIPVMVARDEHQIDHVDTDGNEEQWYYSLGGNHLCEALCRILKNDENDNYASLRKIKARIYKPMKSHEGRNIGNIHNGQIQSMPLTFQDKVWQARLLANEIPKEANFRECVKQLLDRLKGIHDKSKDSLSTVISVASYNDANYELFKNLVTKHELEHGVTKSIPQKLFRVLQGMNAEDDISTSLKLAIESSMSKAAEITSKEKKRRQLKDIFISQTNSYSWECAKHSYPEHAEILEEYTDIHLQRGGVPEEIVDLCNDAINHRKPKTKKLKIDIKVRDATGKEIEFRNKKLSEMIIRKYADKLNAELKALEVLASPYCHYSEDEIGEDIDVIPETQSEI